MINWEQMKQEYVHSSIGLRGLAKTYGANENSVFYRAKREGWYAEKKAQIRKQDSLNSRLLQDGTEAKAIDSQDIEKLVDKLYKKASFAIDALSDESPDTQRLRHLVQSVKDLKDLAKQEDGKDSGKLEALVQGLCQL